MNIQELLNEMQSFRESLEQPTKDLAAAPADMEKVEVDQINPKEPEVDAKGEKSVCDIVKALEDYQAELDKIKKEDPETKFEMIDNKDPMRECDALQKATEKQNRKEEIKKGINKRVKRPEVVEESVQDPEYTVLYRVKKTDEPVDDPYTFNNYNDAKYYFDAMKKDCPPEYYVQLNKLNKEEDMYDDICNTFDESMLDVANKTKKVDLEKVVKDQPETKEIELPEPEVDCKKEVEAAIEEPKEIKVEDIVKIEESVQDEVVAKYETVDGKHEIIRTSEGLYKNRYYLKEDGKARRTTRGVKNLPTAVGAMMKRFPEAVEIVDEQKPEPPETK